MKLFLKNSKITLKEFADILEISRPTLNTYLRLWRDKKDIPNKKIYLLFSNIYSYSKMNRYITMSQIEEFLSRINLELIKSECENNKKMKGVIVDYDTTSKVKVINLTPHSIDVVDKDKKVRWSIPSEGLARVEIEEEKVGSINGVMVTKNKYSNITGLPKEKKGVKYIVSFYLLKAGLNRKDLLVPAHPIKNKNGVVIACRSFTENI